MLLQFQCIRKHLIFDKTYTLTCDGREVFIGEKKSKPKYYFEISLNNFIVFHTDADYYGFSIPYRGQLKLFRANSSKIRELKKQLSGKILFGDMNSFFLQRDSLGSGGFSQVQMLENLDSRELVAAKFLQKVWQGRSGSQRLKDIMNEISIVQSLNHPNIIKVREAYNRTKDIVIIYEYVDGYTLQNHLENHHISLTQSEVQSVMRQLVLTLFYIHEHKLIHRDIKPENIMIEKNQNIKIIDFGLASKIGASSSDICGTIGYIAPEVLCLTTDNPIYTLKCDMFAAGAVFYKLITMNDLYSKQEDYSNTKLNLDLLKLLHTPDTGIDLLQRMLDFNYKQRISAKDALAHPYFMESLRVSAKKSLKLSQLSSSQLSQPYTADTPIQPVNIFVQNLEKKFKRCKTDK